MRMRVSEYTILVGLIDDNTVRAPRLEVFYPAEGLAVVSFIGEHDLSTRDRARTTLLEVLEPMSPDEIFVADLGNATYVDASIVDCLCEADALAAELGVVFRVEPGEESIVNEALSLTGMLGLFTHHT
jgi:anti-anti-sigma regulatory factor